MVINFVLRYKCSNIYCNFRTGLVFGERMLTSLAVMNEIFGEQEMLVFHRVALEMELADRVRPPNAEGVRANGVEIIQLDDDDEMLEVAHVVGQGHGGTTSTEGKCEVYSRLLFKLDLKLIQNTGYLIYFERSDICCPAINKILIVNN